MSAAIPAEAKAVIVGGGVIGCSVAYHLTKLGWKGVVLLEQNQIAAGTSWHAAGLIGRLRTTNSMTKINKYSAELYAALERETGQSTGWKQVGSLIVAKSSDRMTQLHRTAAISEWFGVEVQIISPQQALEKWPLLRVDDVKGGAWLPHDGKVIPQNLALALAQGARNGGTQICEGVGVTAILTRGGRVFGVKTSAGTIQSEYVVLTTGMWSRQLGLRSGVNLPLYPVEHHYVVSGPITGAFDELPVGRDPDLCIYFRGEGNAVVLGAFQKYTKPWLVPEIPRDFAFKLLDPDWEKFQDPLAAGKWRIPALDGCQFDRFVNGPESFTPDNNFLMGETPELKNLYVATGFNSVGIASAGGAGKYLAEWMSAGQPTLDLWSVDVRRFGAYANNIHFLRERVTEVLGLHYQMAWPNREFESGRGLRKSALHDRLAGQGAVFGSKNGWERPNWFARDGVAPVVEYSFGRQNWFPCHAAEHRAARESVALFDQTGFSKFLLKGRDALVLLQYLCGGNVDVPTGVAVYTGMFNQLGGFESDLTVIRLAIDEFYLVSGTATTVRDFDWITCHIRPGMHAELVDITSSLGVLGVMGPRSRDLLSRVTDAKLANESFPFGSSQSIAVGSAAVRAVRLTYVGELGWELHVPTEQLAMVYDDLWKAGGDLGVTNAGHYAINSLRLEKAYRAWGADISPDDTPLEAGLGFAVCWTKPFLGRDMLLKQKAKPLTRRLVTFVLDDPDPVLWGSEPIYRDGQMVGYTTSGAYGHTLGRAVGLGYVNYREGVSPAFIESGKFEINVNGRRCSAKAYLRPPYDPTRARVLT